MDGTTTKPVSDTYLLTQLSKVDQVQAQVESTQNLVQLNGVAITKESVERINADSALDGRISDLSNTQINDKAYLVAEIERHHDELSGVSTGIRADLNDERHSRLVSEAHLAQSVSDLGQSVTHSLTQIGSEVNALSDYLDTATADTDELTADSEDYEINWSLLSASQEWRLEIDEYIRQAEVRVVELLKGNEIKVDQAITDSGKALENSDINRLIVSLQGKVGSELLDNALNGKLDFLTSNIDSLHTTVIDGLRQQSEELSARVIGYAVDMSDRLELEAQERIDNATRDAVRVQTLIELENGERLEAINQTTQLIQDTNDALLTRITRDSTQLSETISTEVAALNARIVAEAKANATSVLETAEALLKEIQAKADSATSALVAKATELSEAFTAQVTKLRADVALDVSGLKEGITQASSVSRTKEGEIITSLNAYKVSNGADVSAVKESIQVVANAHGSTAEKLGVLTTSFNGLVGEVSQAQADIISSAKAISDGDSALATQIGLVTAKAVADKKELNAQISDVNSAVVKLDSATATKFSEVNASIADVTTDVGALSEATAKAQKTADSAVTVNSAQATDISGLQSRMTATEGTVAKKADTTALNALSTSVNGLDEELTVQAESITALGASLATVDSKTDKAIANAATAQQTADSAVTVNTAQAVEINALNARMTTTEGGITKKADASALSSLESKVDNNETAMAQRIDNLAASLTELGEGAETLVDANAFNALKADTNNTKGVVSGHTSAISGLQASLAQVVDDVDSNTTAISANSKAISDTNSQVASVKGEVSAQGNALTTITNDLATTNANVDAKADASTVSGISNRVSSAEGKLVSQGDAITVLNNSLSTTNANIATKADATSLTTLTNRVTATEGENATQSTAITALNNGLTSTNKAVATKAETSALNAVDSKVTEANGKITANTNALSALSGRVETTENGLKTKVESTTLNNYYTKTAADTAISGKVDKFDASLKIGGVNLFKPSMLEHVGYNADGSFHYHVDGRWGFVHPVVPSEVYSLSRSKTHGSRFTCGFVKSLTAPQVYGGVFDFNEYPSQLAYENIVVPAEATYMIVYLHYVGTWVAPLADELQLERGSKATAIRVSPDVTTESLNANATAINATNTEVSRVDGMVTAQGSSISKLQSDLTAVDAKTNQAIASTATAQTTANTAVTSSNANASQLTTLASTLKTSLSENLWTHKSPTVWVNEAGSAVASATSSESISFKTVLKTFVSSYQSVYYDKMWKKPTTPPVNNESYIVTFEMRASRKSALNILYIRTARNNSNDYKYDVLTNTEWQTYSYVVSSNLANSTDALSQIFGYRVAVADGWVADDWIEFRNVRLVRESADLVDPQQIKADLTNLYYTKTDADKATAGQLTQYKASFTLGGRNLVRDSAKSGTGWEWIVNLPLVKHITGNITVSYDCVLAEGKEATGSGVGFRNVDGKYKYYVYPKNDTGRTVLHFTADSGDFTHLGIYVNSTCTISNVMVEMGDTASEWSPAPEDLQQSIDVATTALNATNVETARVDGVVTTQGSLITGLRSDLTAVDTKAGTAITNAANAQNTANSAVSANASTASSLDTLNTKFSLSARAGANLLINSNEEKAYLGNGAYPHGVYELGEAWDVGATYTLVWCATHQREATDAVSSLAVYAGGGSQTVDVFSNETKRVRSITFQKTDQGTSRFLHFYLLSGAYYKVQSTAITHWAVLVKGTFASVDAWIPSAYDYITANRETSASLTSARETLANADKALGLRIDSLTTTVSNDKLAVTGSIKDVATSVSTLEGTTNSLITAVKGEVSGLKNTVSSYDETINTWAEVNKSQAVKIEKMTAELIPAMAGNETLLAGSTQSVVGYEGVITQLADANAATQWQMEKFTASFGDDFSRVNAKLEEVTSLVATADGVTNQRFLDMTASFESQVNTSIEGMLSDISETKEYVDTAIVGVLGEVKKVEDNIATTVQPALTKLSASIAQDYITKADAQTAISAIETTLTSKVDAVKLDSTVIPDTRSDNQLPQWYRTHYASRQVTEFKFVSVIGATAILPALYCTLTTTVSWDDSSGGPIKQIAVTGAESEVAVRYSGGEGGSEVWTPWTRQGAGATLGLEATIAERTQTINGIQAVKTVTIDNNGIMSGYGLVSELTEGKVTSAFGVNADQFYVGAPATGKKVFSVVNGVTTINDAVIGNLSADKITTGSFSADRIEAGSIKADKLAANSITADKFAATSVSGMFADFGTFTSSNSSGSFTMSGSLISLKDASGNVLLELGLLS